MNNRPIGFFDSGLGGLSVLKDAIALMPEENFLYYGDTANAPYGSRSLEEIKALTLRSVSYLMSENIKALVIACNTATSAAIEALREKLDIPVIGMEPAVKPALEFATEGRVLVMATPATVSFSKFHELVEKYHGEDRIITLPCPDLAALIERNALEEVMLDQYLEKLFAPFKNENISAIVLGCTHYLFIKDKIASYFPDTTRLFDGNAGTVSRLKNVLIEKGLKLPESNHKGKIVLNSSQSDQHTMKLYTQFLFK